jgi:hypothetical protein
MALLVEPKTIVRRLTPTCHQGPRGQRVGRAANARATRSPSSTCSWSSSPHRDGDAAGILHQFDQDRVRLVGRLEKASADCASGNGGKPTFSASLFQWMEDAWTVSSLETDATRLRTGALLLQFIANPGEVQRRDAAELEAIPRDQLKQGARRHRGGLQGVGRGRRRGPAGRDLRAPAAGLPRWRGPWRPGRPRTSRASARTSPRRPATARSTRSSAATRRSASWWTSSRAAGRTTPSSWARRAWARPPWSRASPSRSSRGDVPEHLKNVELIASTSARSRPARG